MRNVTIAAVILVAAAGAQAQEQAAKPEKAPKAEHARGGHGAAAEAQKALDKMDELYNAHDAKGLIAMLDKNVVGGGPYLGSKLEDYESMKTTIEQMAAAGGHLARQNVVFKVDEDGDTAWYVADYLMIPKVPPGALPVRRPMRESGVLVRHGREWRLAGWQLASLVPAPPAPAAPQNAPAGR